MTTSSEPGKALDATDATHDVFVGRRRELEAFGRSLDAVAAGEGRLEIVSGAPGIGKTRLAYEFATIARARGLCVLRGHCWEGEGAPAYWPWAEVLRNYLDGIPEQMSKHPTDLGHLLNVAAICPDASTRGPASVDLAKDAQQARFVLFDHVYRFLAATASSEPMLVVLDDMHWADVGSLLLLQFLAVRVVRLPVVLLITSREPLPELVASTSRHAWARHQALRGLNRVEAKALLATRTVKRAVLERLMTLTEGNPYFLKELGQLFVQDSDLDPIGDLPLPTSLLVVALQQYRRLSLKCQSLLQAASVVGRDFDVDLLSRSIGLAICDALHLLDEAVERQVITSTAPGRYHFSHALVREAIHDQLHPSARARLHANIALALEFQIAAGERVSPAILAHHFCMGLPFTQRREAAMHGIAAGDAAHAAFAYEEAVFQFRRARELLGATLTQVESCDLLLSLGAAEAGAGEWARSRRTFEDAAAGARRLGSAQRLARAALGFKGMMWATIPVDTDAITLLEEARTTLGEGSPALEVQLLSALSRSLYFSHETERARRYSDRAVEVASSIPDDRLHAVAIEAHTVGLLQPTKSQELLDSATTLIELSDRIQDAELRFNARIFRQYGLLSLGLQTEADTELGLASQIADSTPHPRFQWQIALLRVARATLQGRLDLADDLSLSCQELGARVHHSSPMQYQLLQGFQRALLRHDLDSWLSSADIVIAQYPNIPAFRIARALILARLRHTDLARESLHELAIDNFAVIPPNNLSLWLLTALAEVAAMTSDHEHAAALYTLLLPHRSQFIVAAWGTLLDGSVSHYLALLADTCGEHLAARSHFELAIRANRRIGAPALTARASLCFALHLLAFGDHSDILRGRLLATQAAGTFRSLGLGAYADKALQCLDICLSGDTKTHPDSSTTPSSPPTPANCFRREGDFWIITFRGRTSLLREIVGLRYLAVLLSSPRTPIHALDLVRSRVAFGSADSQTDQTFDLQSDRRARSQYRQRLRDVLKEIEDAASNNDIGMRERLVEERDSLLDELRTSFSVSGAPRPYRSNAERARVSVRNRIASALARLRMHDPACAHYLERSIKTGTLCVYDPIECVAWCL